MIDTTYYTYYKGEYIQVHPIEDCMKSILIVAQLSRQKSKIFIMN